MDRPERTQAAMPGMAASAQAQVAWRLGATAAAVHSFFDLSLVERSGMPACLLVSLLTDQIDNDLAEATTLQVIQCNWQLRQRVDRINYRLNPWAVNGSHKIL